MLWPRAPLRGTSKLIALIATGIIYALVLARLRPRVLEQAPALLEGGDGEDPAPDPLAVSG